MDNFNIRDDFCAMPDYSEKNKKSKAKRVLKSIHINGGCLNYCGNSNIVKRLRPLLAFFAARLWPSKLK